MDFFESCTHTETLLVIYYMSAFIVGQLLTFCCSTWKEVHLSVICVFQSYAWQ